MSNKLMSTNENVFKDYLGVALAEAFHKAIDEQIARSVDDLRQRLLEITAKAAVRIASQANVTMGQDKIVVELKFSGN